MSEVCSFGLGRILVSKRFDVRYLDASGFTAQHSREETMCTCIPVGDYISKRMLDMTSEKERYYFEYMRTCHVRVSIKWSFQTSQCQGKLQCEVHHWVHSVHLVGLRKTACHWVPSIWFDRCCRQRCQYSNRAYEAWSAMH